MGLLDDAIREHLELKRRRGADPGAVEREERDALAPVFAHEDEHPHGDPADGAEHEVPDGHPADAVSGEDQPVAGAELEDLSTVGQETAELDMRAVMDEDAPAPAPAPAPEAAPIADPAVGRDYAREIPADDPPIEWEATGEEPSERMPQDIAGQERLSFE